MKQKTSISGNRAVLDRWFVDRDPRLSEEYHKIRLIEPLILVDMKLFSEEFGLELKKLENSVKTATSIEDKLLRTEEVKNIFGEKFNELEAFRSFKDNIRYTMIAEHDEIFDKGKMLINALENNGYVLSGFKNHFRNQSMNLDYKGLHIDFITPFGQEIEIQLHSNITFQANRESHKLYEIARKISTPTEEKQLLKEKINKIYAAIPDSKGFDKFPYVFELENKEKVIDNMQKEIDLHVDYVQTEANNSPYVLSYSVYIGGQEILEGYEHIFSDGSACVYQYNALTKTSFKTSLSPNGDEIKTIELPKQETDLFSAIESATMVEKSHLKWVIEDELEHTEEILEIG